jgi:membrane associated rhomboid family serine protease
MRVDGKGIAFKLRRIYVPLLVLSLAFLAGYSLLNWILVARSGLIPVSDNVVDDWLPLGAAWILVLLLIQPMLGLLKRDAKGNSTFLYHFAAVAFVAVPTIVAQGYIRTGTGDITHVTDASEITSAAATKYYSADEICVSYKDASFEPVVWASGKGNTLNVDVYAVEPVCPNMFTIPGTRSVWIGLKAHTSFNNSLDQPEKEARYRAFLKQADAQFRGEDPRSYRFLERTGRNADGKGFAAALRRAGVLIAPPSAVVLVPHQELFEQRTGNRLQWIPASYATGAIVWLAFVLICPLDDAKVRRWIESGRARGLGERLRRLRLLLPRRDAYGLQLLLGVNILVFVAMVLAGLGMVSFDTQDLLAWGANYRPSLHGFGVLRLISSQFVHGGIMHLLGNLYGLLFAGAFLTLIARNAGLIACYLLCGLGGSITSAIVHPATVSVGASGAIFGMFGILLTLVVLRDERIAELRNLILINVAIFVPLNLFLGLVSHGIDNAAHVGGLATGILLGLAIFFARLVKRPKVNADKGTQHAPLSRQKRQSPMP